MVKQLQMNFPGTDGNTGCNQVPPQLFNACANQMDAQDKAFHRWYRFVLAYPPHLVRDYLTRFGLSYDSVILDPFCGTGTTLIEAKLAGMRAIGIEANPFAHFATETKLNWRVDAEAFLSQAHQIAQDAYVHLHSQGIEDDPSIGGTQCLTVNLNSLRPETQCLLLNHSISPLPLHKTLILLDCIQKYQHQEFYSHALLALANALVFKISNLHFGPEVGVRNPKSDAPVIANWLLEVEKIVCDLKMIAGRVYPDSLVYSDDARTLHGLLPESVDAVVTSPPYPNEKDYTRTTRLESVLLGFIKNKAELYTLKKRLLCSNTRNAHKDNDDDQWVSDYPEIQHIAETIEKRRIELQKTSGFERLYSRVTKLYFGGMVRHLSSLRHVLKPGAWLAYVVGDQASYFQVMIRTGQNLVNIAQSLGYELVGIDLFRTRLATATKEQLREEVVVLRWHGR